MKAKVVNWDDRGVIEHRGNMSLAREPLDVSSREHFLDGNCSLQDLVKRSADLSKSTAGKYLAEDVARRIRRWSRRSVVE